MDPLAHLTKGAEDLGSASVGCFFLLSGFLITRSFENTRNLGRYLWHRVLRIFPAFWVCLGLVAFGFAPAVCLHERGTLHGFWLGSPSPWSYVTANFFLVMRQYQIDGLLSKASVPLLFNHSLWTLEYEFFCYLVVGALGTTILADRKPFVFLIPFAGCLTLFTVASLIRGFENPSAIFRVLELYTFFTIGSCAYLFRDRIPMRGLLAVFCALAIVAIVPTRAYGVVLPLALSYLTLYAAMHLPIRNFDRRCDLSYGVYIYAFPIQQLLAAFGASRAGYFGYSIAAMTLSCALATTSWFLVEKRCLSLKNVTIEGFWRRRAAQTTAPG